MPASGRASAPSDRGEDRTRQGDVEDERRKAVIEVAADDAQFVKRPGPTGWAARPRGSASPQNRNPCASPYPATAGGVRGIRRRKPLSTMKTSPHAALEHEPPVNYRSMAPCSQGGTPMIDWLIRRFVAGADNVQDPAVRTRYGQFAGTVGIICNVALCLAKGRRRPYRRLRLHRGRRRQQPLRRLIERHQPARLQVGESPGRTPSTPTGTGATSTCPASSWRRWCLPSASNS